MAKGGLMRDSSFEYIEHLKRVLDEFPHLHFERLIDVLLSAYHNEQHIFVMGNGGSAATASHWVADLNKGCCLDQKKKFRMMSLSDNISSMLAYANDISFDGIFVEQLKNFFVPGDVVIGISGSGNSKNVLNAIDYANDHGGITVGLCGFSGGQLYRSVEVPILARVKDMQIVEDIHMVVVHMTMQRLIKELSVLHDVEELQEHRLTLAR
jgi:D-sedoheptulose 7-phosphate isomerase